MFRCYEEISSFDLSFNSHSRNNSEVTSVKRRSQSHGLSSCEEIISLSRKITNNNHCNHNYHYTSALVLCLIHIKSSCCATFMTARHPPARPPARMPACSHARMPACPHARMHACPHALNGKMFTSITSCSEVNPFVSNFKSISLSCEYKY